jgi:hypothetical protein
MSPVGKTLAGLGTDMLTVAVLRADVMALAIGTFLVFSNPAALRSFSWKDNPCRR